MPGSDGIALSWRKSSASASGDCVEVAAGGNYVLLRDSKVRNSHVLGFASAEWRAFLSDTHSGKYDTGTLNNRPGAG